ncbi:MAG: phosphatase PAP2 family protein [Cyanobacteria bacterium P01_A01_bin.37]
MKRLQLWQQLRSFLTYGQKLLTRHYQELLLLLLGVFFPLQIFGELADNVWEQEGFAWDKPILLNIYATASPRLDSFAIALTKLGVFWGVAPAAIVIGFILLRQRHWRSLIYFCITLAGSTFINVATKLFLGRPRPMLWESPAPELDYSFPSGHAMASMTLVAALVILLQGSRWQRPIAIVGGVFVLAIGWTRLYLGVHYPSDIVAGWMASITWAVGVALLVRPHPLFGS